MAMKEFFIYSRRKPPNDFVRLTGISGSDITTNYTDESALHKYSSKEWSLHCRGLIHLNIDASLISSMFDLNSILHRLLPSNNPQCTTLADDEKEDDIEKLYQYFSECGLSFGSQFRSIKKLYRYKSEALSEISIPSTLVREENYLCHPAILDGCFQGMISVVPGDFYDTFIPTSIDEIILCYRKTSLVSFLEQPNTKFYANQSLKNSIKGLTSEKTFLSDIVVFHQSNFSSSSLTPVMIFRGFQIQHYSKEKISKSIIRKVEESDSIYHNNPKKLVPVPQLIEHFCAYQSWKSTEFHLAPISQLTDIEQFWMIFADRKYHIGTQIAQILHNDHRVKHENILLIFFSTIDRSSYLNDSNPSSIKIVF